MVNALVLDAGALIALERDDRTVWSALSMAVATKASIQVPTGVVAQVWRDGRRQAQLSRALAHCDEVHLDGARSRAAGILCGISGTSDIVDASVALAAATLARSGPTTAITSDPDDLRPLLENLGSSVRILEV